jgi:hypothetical protein
VAETFTDRATREFRERQAAPAAAPTSYAEQFEARVRERADMAMTRFRDTTSDTAAQAVEQSSRAREVLGQDVPAEQFLNEGQVTDLFRSAEARRRASTLNPRLAQWAADEPVNAVFVREHGEELSTLQWTFEQLGRGSELAGVGLTKGVAAQNAERILRREQERASDQDKSFSQLVGEEQQEAADLFEQDSATALSAALKNVRAAFAATMAPIDAARRRLRAAGGEPSEEYLAKLEEYAAEARVAATEATERAVNRWRRGRTLRRADEALHEIEQQDFEGPWDKFGAQLNWAASDPEAAITWLAGVTLESAAPALAGAATTAATRTPAAGAATMGGINLSRGLQTAERQIAEETGYDLSTREGVLGLLRDPKARDIWRDRATAYAVTLAAVDQLSFGIGARQLASSPFGDAILQGLTQAAMGSSGEALALLASEQQLDPLEIAVEGLAEMLTMPAERAGAVGRVGFGRVKRQQEARSARRFFEALGDTSANSELRQKAPKKYREAVDALTRNGPVENVEIDANGLDELFQSGRATPEQVAEAVPSLTAGAIERAVVEGTDLVIPTADYAAGIAGSDLDAALRKHMRLNGSLTAAELDAMEDPDLQRELDEGIRQVDARVGGDATSEQQAQDELERELQNAGRAPEIARAEAEQMVAFARTMAQRLGVSTDEFLRKNPLPRVFRVGQEDAAAPPRENLRDLRAAGGAEAQVIEDAARAADLPEDASEDELADALRTFVGPSIGADETQEAAGQRVAARSGNILEQRNRGSFTPPAGRGTPVIRLFRDADLSTVLHESAHYFLNTYQRLIDAGEATSELAADYERLKNWWIDNAEQVAKESGGPVTAFQVKQYMNKGTTGDDGLDARVYKGAHEMFARGYEAYLFEGKAPSSTLGRLFDMFTTWLMSVYRSAKQLGVPMSDEVRGVFDRMLATDEEIEKARAESQYVDMIARSAEELQISEDEYAELVRLSTEAQDDTRRRLLADTMAPLKAEALEKKREATERIRAEVAEKINAKPVHRVREWLGNGRWLGRDAPEDMPEELRFDRDMLVDAYGEEVLRELPRGRRPLFKAGTGLHPEDVATWFGFSSGDELIDALRNAPGREAEIEAEVSRRAAEEVDDPLADGTIAEKATQALNGDKRGELIAAELRALSKNASKSVPRTTRSQARQAARRRIAMTPVREAIKYRGFLQSMQRASQRAQEALAKGDIDAAYDQKRKELLNHALYMEAREASENVAKWERKAQRLKRKGTRENIAGVYLEAIDEIMARYDFRKTTAASERRRGALAAYLEQMEEQNRLNEVSIPQSVIEETRRRPYKTLPYNKLQGVMDALANIEHTGRNEKKLTDAEAQRDLDEAVQTALETARENVKGKPPPRTRDAEGFASGLRYYLNLALNTDSLLREYDGFRIGEMYDLVKAPVDRASSRAQEMRREAAERLDEIYDTYTAAERRQMAKQQTWRELGTARDPAPEFSQWDFISMALNMGNQENLDRLMDKKNGLGFSPSQIDLIKGQLSDRDWDFVESVWSYLEEFWPQIEARERRQTGVAPKRVQPVGFELPNGRQLRGGYYPISYDARLDSRVEAEQVADLQQQMMAGRFGKAQTANGHTKERASGSGGRALEIGMHVLHQHLAKVTHDLALGEAVGNTWKILQHPEMVQFFEENNRAADRTALELWIQDVATGPAIGGGPLGRMAVKLKNNFTLSKLAFNMSTVLIQMTGITQSMVVVGKTPLLKAYAKYMQGPEKWTALAKERSEFMRERETTFQRDVFDLMGDTVGSPLDSAWKRWQQAVGRVGFFLMQKVQFYGVDVPTWIAAYDNAVAEGKTDERARFEADRLVARAQASGLMSDRSAFERGTLSRDSRQGGFVRLFTALGSYMFAKGNIAYERVNRGQREVREAGFSPRAFTAAASTTFDLALLFTFEAIAYHLIKGTLPDGEDDEEGDGVSDEWAAFMARETVFAILGSIPIIREGSSALQGFSGGGAYGSIAETFARPWQQAAQGEADQALLNSILNAAGTATGFPSSAASRVTDGLFEMLDEDGQSPAPIEFLMGARE